MKTKIANTLGINSVLEADADEQTAAENSSQAKILKMRMIDLELNAPDVTTCACRCISHCSCDCDRGGIIS